MYDHIVQRRKKETKQKMEVEKITNPRISILI